MSGEKEMSVVRITNLQLITLSAITVVSFFANIAGLFLGLSVITPLLFYLPVILAAYWFPKKGVLFSVGVGILEVFLMYLYSYPPNLPEITYAVTTASFYVLVAIAIIISSLSGNLREREARYHGIFDHSETGIFLLQNGDHNMIVEANPRGASLLGYNPKDLVGKPFSGFWTDGEKKKTLFQALSRGGSSPAIETAVKGASGEIIPVLMTTSRLPEGMLVLTLTDISAQKAQEEEIRARNRQLSTMNAVIAEASGASSVESIGKRTLNHIMELVGCEFGGIYFPGEAGHRPALEFHQGDESLLTDLNGSADEYAKEWRLAIERNRSFFFSRDCPPGEAGAGASAGIVLPIPGKGDPLGALYLATRNPWKCPSAEKEILDSLAREIGTAVSRVRLAEELTDANHQANLYLDMRDPERGQSFPGHRDLLPRLQREGICGRSHWRDLHKPDWKQHPVRRSGSPGGGRSQPGPDRRSDGIDCRYRSGYPRRIETRHIPEVFPDREPWDRKGPWALYSEFPA